MKIIPALYGKNAETARLMSSSDQVDETRHVRRGLHQILCGISIYPASMALNSKLVIDKERICSDCRFARE
jgi:hypothetical protein